MNFPFISSGIHNTVWIKQAQENFKYVHFIGCRFLYKRSCMSERY